MPARSQPTGAAYVEIAPLHQPLAQPGAAAPAAKPAHPHPHPPLANGATRHLPIEIARTAPYAPPPAQVRIRLTVGVAR